MPHRLAVLSLPVLLAALALAAPAGANWHASEPIDGPSAIEELGGVDLARDGSGGVVYLKRDGGVPHVFLARLANGAWRPPERVDVGVDAPATEAAIAVADQYRLVVVWVAGGTVYGSYVVGGEVGPASAAQPLGDEARDVAVDMGINGTAYATFTTTAGAGGADVRAVRLQATTWELVPLPLDIDPGLPAGAGAGRARVAVSAEGNAVATWAEAGAVFARRITGLNVSAAPQQVSHADGPADSPEIDIEDDGSFAWVAYRQDTLGETRTYGRRLVGSLFEAPEELAGAGSDAPRLAIDGRGIGLAVANGGSAVIGSPLVQDKFQPAQRLDYVGGGRPAVAVSERRDAAAVWSQGDGALVGRYRPENERFQEPVALGTPDYGPVLDGAYSASADRAGDAAVAMVQGPPDARWVTVAHWDRTPSPPWIYSSTRFQKRVRPLLRWRPGLELWGETTFRVLVDGQEIGRSQSGSLQVAQPLATGAHRLRIVAVDRRGQTAVSRERYIRVDTEAPRVKVRISGRRRAGQRLKVRVTALDGNGSGIESVEIDWGDRGGRLAASSGSHRYRAGKFTLVVKAVDRAGNVTRQEVKLRIKRR